MNIQKFNQLLKAAKSPNATAYIPEKSGKRLNKVAVVYSPGGTVYTYGGSLMAVAEKMNLVPEVSVVAEAKEAVTQLRETGRSGRFHSWILDTVRFNLNMPGKNAVEEKPGRDEFGRKTACFVLEDVGAWV